MCNLQFAMPASKGRSPPQIALGWPADDHVFHPGPDHSQNLFLERPTAYQGHMDASDASNFDNAHGCVVLNRTRLWYCCCLRTVRAFVSCGRSLVIDWSEEPSE